MCSTQAPARAETTYPNTRGSPPRGGQYSQRVTAELGYQLDSLLADNRATPADAAVLVAELLAIGQGERHRHTREEVAEIAGVSARQVTRSRRVLADLGLLRVTRRWWSGHELTSTVRPGPRLARPPTGWSPLLTVASFKRAMAAVDSDGGRRWVLRAWLTGDRLGHHTTHGLSRSQTWRVDKAIQRAGIPSLADRLARSGHVAGLSTHFPNEMSPIPDKRFVLVTAGSGSPDAVGSTTVGGVQRAQPPPSQPVARGQGGGGGGHPCEARAHPDCFGTALGNFRVCGPCWRTIRGDRSRAQPHLARYASEGHEWARIELAAPPPQASRSIEEMMVATHPEDAVTAEDGLSMIERIKAERGWR